VPKDFWVIDFSVKPKPLARAVKPSELKDYNEKKWDCYYTLNDVSGFGKRTKADLTAITCFFCDIDTGTKFNQMKRIESGPVPTSIVETSKGYHVAFGLIDPIDCTKDPVAMSDWFRTFQLERITPFFGGDDNAADATRLMRVPGFKYWKDGLGEKVIKQIHRAENRLFKLSDIEKAFPVLRKIEITEDEKFIARELKKNSDGSFISKCNAIDPVAGLTALSGTAHVNGEAFTFTREKDIVRINVNGKPSNAWVDKSGRIGSLYFSNDGTPVAGTVWNWLSFYGHSRSTIAKIFKEFFNVS
jgi:hypothetical protein